MSKYSLKVAESISKSEPVSVKFGDLKVGEIFVWFSVSIDEPKALKMKTSLNSYIRLDDGVITGEGNTNLAIHPIENAVIGLEEKC